MSGQQRVTVSLTDYAIDGLSVEFSIETARDRYTVHGLWSQKNGWTAGVEDEHGECLTVSVLAGRLGYDSEAHLLGTLTDGLFEVRDRRFELLVKVGPR